MAAAFAASIGAHDTGACMGMPHAMGAIGERRALLLMAPAALVGATVASHAVERTVGDGLLTARLSDRDAVLVLALALGLTTLYNRLRLPTSTIQLLVFSVLGVALGTGVGVRWPTLALLAAVWAAAPVAAAGLGYGLTRTLDATILAQRRAGGVAGTALVLAGTAAAFTMGANDVANATGEVVGSHVLGVLAAGALGGAGLAVGVLAWGGSLLRRVAFDIVAVDRPMATAAQTVQAGVVLAAAGLGFFTSLNQAMVGAMAGAGLARGRQTVHGAVLAAILRGWAIGPPSAAGIGFGLARVLAGHPG